MSNDLARFIETYRGSSFPTRAETADGEICVVKMSGAGNGSAALLSEFVVNRLTSRTGFATPNASIIHIADDYPWNFGTDEFYDIVRKSPGPNLALAWLDGACPVNTAEYNSLDAELVSQVVTLDLTFANCDRSARSSNLVRDQSGHPWIIDHGACRFLFQPPDSTVKPLPETHIFADRQDAFDPSRLVSISSTLIAETMAEIPEAWLVENRLSRDDVARSVAARIAMHTSR
jgi:hypothetical protein